MSKLSSSAPNELLVLFKRLSHRFSSRLVEFCLILRPPNILAYRGELISRLKFLSNNISSFTQADRRHVDGQGIFFQQHSRDSTRQMCGNEREHRCQQPSLTLQKRAWPLVSISGGGGSNLAGFQCRHDIRRHNFPEMVAIARHALSVTRQSF